MADDREPSVLVLPPRGRGRPRVAERSVSVSAWVPEGTYDRLVRLAKAHDPPKSVSSLMKSLLMMRLPR